VPKAYEHGGNLVSVETTFVDTAAEQYANKP
jgi:hypothetical protein